MIRLESVRRNSGGRVHLTPRIPQSGPVRTLCGKMLESGAYSSAEEVADCINCIRRSRDQSRISSAFFEQDEGSQLLRLSLEQARERRPAQPQTVAPTQERKPVLRLVPSPPGMPEQVGELLTNGFKSAGQGVWRSPAGVVVRMAGPKRDRFAELVFDGSIVATREGSGMRLRAGDVELRPVGDGVEVRIRRS